MNEFDIIKKYFFKAGQLNSVRIGNGDDCAIINVPENTEIAMSMDTLVAGVHFDNSFSPENIGYKSLAVNLSDLAAVGAKPEWVMLSLTLPSVDETFLNGFHKGFFEHFTQHPMTLIGGDLTRGPLSITIQVSGFTPTSSAILRRGAMPGDRIYVTHELGDAVLALRYLQKKIALSDADAQTILPRLYRPTPRIAEAILLRDIATSAIDISDGLYGDLKHILDASHVGAKLWVDHIPVSAVLANQPNELRRACALYSGDAYELCFTAAKNVTLPTLPCKVTCVGEITGKLGIEVVDNTECIVNVLGESYRHF